MAHSRCLVFIGAADLDFLDGARCAVDEIPKAELLLLAESDHYAAHMSPDEVVLEAAASPTRELTSSPRWASSLTLCAQQRARSSADAAAPASSR
jgi:hypothetical protein